MGVGGTEGGTGPTGTIATTSVRRGRTQPCRERPASLSLMAREGHGARFARPREAAPWHGDVARAGGDREQRGVQPRAPVRPWWTAPSFLGPHVSQIVESKSIVSCAWPGPAPAARAFLTDVAQRKVRRQVPTVETAVRVKLHALDRSKPCGEEPNVSSHATRWAGRISDPIRNCPRPVRKVLPIQTQQSGPLSILGQNRSSTVLRGTGSRLQPSAGLRTANKFARLGGQSERQVPLRERTFGATAWIAGDVSRGHLEEEDARSI